jgi:hypothetical protein
MRTRRSLTIRDLFWLWLAISAVWILVIAFQTWRDLPHDDWVIESPASQTGDAETARPITGIFDNPVARAVTVNGVELALIPPILALVCGSAFIWAFRQRN